MSMLYEIDAEIHDEDTHFFQRRWRRLSLGSTLLLDKVVEDLVHDGIFEPIQWRSVGGRRDNGL